MSQEVLFQSNLMKFYFMSGLEIEYEKVWSDCSISTDSIIQAGKPYLVVIYKKNSLQNH